MSSEQSSGENERVPGEKGTLRTPNNTLATLFSARVTPEECRNSVIKRTKSTFFTMKRERESRGEISILANSSFCAKAKIWLDKPISGEVPKI